MARSLLIEEGVEWSGSEEEEEDEEEDYVSGSKEEESADEFEPEPESDPGGTRCV